MKIHYTSPICPDYPPHWLTLSTYPKTAAYRGPPLWLTERTLSIVGSRAPMSESVRWLEKHLPPVLKELSLTVVSGGAKGIDQLAHRLAMEAGRPTICVLPSGLENPYPYDVGPFLERILKNGGTVVSTYADSDSIRRHHFAVRNRWIAGLSPVCFVVEANLKSGSMLTAKLAIEEDRAVATLPVSPLSRQGLGNLQLLIDGAQMIRDSLDLKVLVSRYLGSISPSFFEATISRECKQGVDSP